MTHRLLDAAPDPPVGTCTCKDVTTYETTPLCQLLPEPLHRPMGSGGKGTCASRVARSEGVDFSSPKSEDGRCGTDGDARQTNHHLSELLTYFSSFSSCPEHAETRVGEMRDSEFLELRTGLRG